ncbi:MAG: 50S ribosomal protein L11 methyltransferase [Desulfobacterales bacterium]|nr:MAG: 50S ribosomal protein L11 methyltransferase [Desulfobacterales bacterium]
MNRSKISTSVPSDSAIRSYDDLFIYFFKGRLTLDENLLNDEFIGNWQEDESSFLFFSKPCREIVDKILGQQPDLTLLDEFHIPYNQWHGNKIEPFQIGRFYISPPWQKSNTKNGPCQDKLRIALDPGVVFGTGTHTTTKDCLEALEWGFSCHKVNSVLDLGTGTGLLALAASKLGCKRTLAIDFNFLAARTAIRNVRLNQLEDRVFVVQGRAEDFIDSSLDLVIANIHYDVMKHLITSQGFFKKKWFILSGLLRSQARDIRYKLSHQPVRILKKWEGDGIWHTFFGETC